MPKGKAEKIEYGFSGRLLHLEIVVTKFAIGCVLAAFLVTPVFATGEKPVGKVDKETCRKLARDKHFVQGGRMLNKAVHAAVVRCMQSGPSAI